MSELFNGSLIKCLKRGVAINDFIKRISENPELWKENTWRQDYVVKLLRPVSPQKDTEAIMFRWAPENTIESVRDSIEVVNNEKNLKLCPEIFPIIMDCLNACGSSRLGRLFIAKLKPGGFVIPHCDFGMYSDQFERFHLVLSSDEGNKFFVQDSKGHTETLHMKPGEFYWFNHKSLHWAENKSQSPRMHLIMDCVAPKYRRERASVSA